MTTLLASTTATGATATEGDVKTFLANMRTFMADLLGTDSANKAAVQALLGNVLNGKVTKSSAYTVVDTDRGKVIDCTGTWTLSLTAAATLSDGFCFALRNSGTGAITIDPNLSETINGLTTFVIGGGEFVIVYCDGTGFSTVGGAAAPVGTVMPTAAASAPVGWLLCYGQAVSRTTYGSLFTAIGTTYGTGDGSTTFNLPDLRGRIPTGKDDMGGTAANRITSGGSGISGTTLGATGGAQTHTLTVAQIPSHDHSVMRGANLSGSYPTANYSYTASGGADNTILSSAAPQGGGAAHNNVQPTVIMNYMIKT